ncbi:uncharacterized protein TRIVIDRAFT_66518 [Trichoderma virens Gv29-8]|uniref:Uncharacterized protein n=1 Tax=Hypocrea virens (strain Gv29-8 / FGSC 10586) TaxID=413071 RepID=G9N7A2_HYPVG|nr:uncharacterized protein TRIVIDRAFT_66518 [Trichoderma virens Gv29-8]EHK17599.1 hypothetical protein TRIVIDRAFT_66518 [Trichoderma virens Gv29-8]
MKSRQLCSSLLLFSSGLMSLVQGQSCTSGHLYCGYTLKNMGWSKNDLIAAVTDDPEPSQGAIDHPNQALFQCLDSEEGIFYIGYCNEGCDAMDDGYDDILRISVKNLDKGMYLEAPGTGS